MQKRTKLFSTVAVLAICLALVAKGLIYVFVNNSPPAPFEFGYSTDDVAVLMKGSAAFESRYKRWLSLPESEKKAALATSPFSSGNEILENPKWLSIVQDGTSKLELPSLPNLEALSLHGIFDQDLPVGKQFPKLKCLSVTGDNVTDEGVAHIARHFPRLIELNLSGTNVTIKSVPALAQLSELRYLNLNYATIESQCINAIIRYGTIPELKLMLPHCFIQIGVR